MKVVVTGASGFLGAHLREALAEHEVTGLCRHPVEGWMVQGDVLDPDSLRAAFAGADAVVHAAGGVSHRAGDTEPMFDVHVTGTRNALEAARERGVSRFVHISTSGTVAVSRDPDFVADEGGPDVLPLVKEWPYYRAKLFAEQEALGFEGLDVFLLNPTLLLGPGDRRGSSTESVRLFLDGELPAVPSGGLSFVDVRDVAAAVSAVLERGQPKRRYLLGAVNLTFAAYYDRLARIADLPAPRIQLPRASATVLGWLPTGLRARAADAFGVDRVELEIAGHTWYLDNRRARAELGWEPRDPGETLADTVEDLRLHPER